MPPVTPLQATQSDVIPSTTNQPFFRASNESKRTESGTLADCLTAAVRGGIRQVDEAEMYGTAEYTGKALAEVRLRQVKPAPTFEYVGLSSSQVEVTQHTNS
jgi:hypothetical protein